MEFEANFDLKQAAANCVQGSRSEGWNRTPPSNKERFFRPIINVRVTFQPGTEIVAIGMIYAGGIFAQHLAQKIFRGESEEAVKAEAEKWAQDAMLEILQRVVGADQPEIAVAEPVPKIEKLDHPLWPRQHELATMLAQDLRTQQYAVAKVGMRTGKLLIALTAAQMTNCDEVYLFDAPITFPAARQYSEKFDFDLYCHGKKIPKRLIENRQGSKCVAIMGEPFWKEDSFDLFTELRQYCPVIVIGSRGPEFDDDVRWRQLGGHSYASWEINPGLTQAQLIKSTDAHEREKEIRDYGSF